MNNLESLCKEAIITEIQVESYSQICTLRFYENNTVSLIMPTEDDEFVAHLEEYQKLVEFLSKHFTDFEKISLYTKISREIRKNKPPVSTILFEFLNRMKK